MKCAQCGEQLPTAGLATETANGRRALIRYFAYTVVEEAGQAPRYERLVCEGAFDTDACLINWLHSRKREAT